MKDRLKIKTERAYETSDNAGGYRVLVDRIWPRGVTKDTLQLDEWIKEIAPSTGLRKWFDHDPKKWREFRKLYFKELDDMPDIIEALLLQAKAGPLTLIYGAKDPAHNNAVALKEYLER